MTRPRPATSSPAVGAPDGRRARDQRDGQDGDGRGGHLHGGDRDRVAAGQQRGLRDDHRRRQDRRGEHQRVAGRRRVPAGAGHERRCPSARRRSPPTRAGRRTAWPRAAVASATRIGTAPRMTAAWVTLVRSMPTFCSTMTAPKPAAPQAAISGVAAARRWRAGDPRQHGRGEAEARDRRPGRVHPPEEDLGHRDGQAPGEAGDGEGDEGTTVLHVGHATSATGQQPHSQRLRPNILSSNGRFT